MPVTRSTWADMDRESMTRSLPPYRHRLGTTPHPRTHPEGHSYGQPEPDSPPLSGANWQRHTAFLRGVHLFNHGYWWEAHEQWEAAWRRDPDPVVRSFLQGLIQSAAALLKREAGSDRGCRALWERGAMNLGQAAARFPICAGVDIAVFTQQMAHTLAEPIPGTGGGAHETGRGPRLDLVPDPTQRQ